MTTPAIDQAAPGAEARSARWHLRDATAAAHAALDAGMARFDLAAPEDYAAFLGIMAGAIGALERGLAHGPLGAVWPIAPRAPSIAADLRGLGRAMPRPGPPLAVHGRAAALGAAYVLEGSRLGGQLLLRRARASASAAVRDNLRFLSHGAPGATWPAFLAVLDAELRGPGDLVAAEDGARAAFAACQNAMEAAQAPPRAIEAE